MTQTHVNVRPRQNQQYREEKKKTRPNTLSQLPLLSLSTKQNTISTKVFQHKKSRMSRHHNTDALLKTVRNFKHPIKFIAFFVIN